MNNILICGDRHWDDRQTIANFLRRFDPRTTRLVTSIVGYRHGQKPASGEDTRPVRSGADLLATEIGRTLGFEVIVVPIHWPTTPVPRHERLRIWADCIETMLRFEPILLAVFHDNPNNDSHSKWVKLGALDRTIPVEEIHTTAGYTPIRVGPVNTNRHHGPYLAPATLRFHQLLDDVLRRQGLASDPDADTNTPTR